MPRKSSIDMEQFRKDMLEYFDSMRERDVPTTLLNQRMAFKYPETLAKPATAYQRVLKVVTGLISEGLVESVARGIYRRTSVELGKVDWDEVKTRRIESEARARRRDEILTVWMDNVLLDVMDKGVPLKYLTKLVPIPTELEHPVLKEDELLSLWKCSINQLMFHHTDKPIPSASLLEQFTDDQLTSEVEKRASAKAEKVKEQKVKIAAEKKKLKIGIIGPQQRQFAVNSEKWEKVSDHPFTLVFIDKSAKLNQRPHIDRLILVEQMVSRSSGVFVAAASHLKREQVHTVPNMGRVEDGLVAAIMAAAKEVK